MKQRSLMSILALSTVGSFTAAAGTVLVLNPEDRISIKRGFLLTALGFVFFLSLFDFLNHVALKTAAGLRLRKKYQLTMGDVMDISNKVVSAVQAALSCLTGAIVCLWSCTRDLLHSSHFMSEAYAWFGAAYFFYDIWSMYKVHITMNSGIPALHSSEKTFKKIVGKSVSSPNMSAVRNPVNGNQSAQTEMKRRLTAVELSGGDAKVSYKPKETPGVTSFFSYCIDQPVILMHHLFIGGFGFLVIVYLRGGLGDCVFGFVYLMELSTPLVSARGILSRLKMKASRLYVANGVAMLVTFFVCRILMMPYVCYLYSQMIGLPYWEAIRGLPTGCKISITILLLPQVYWFYLMMAGAFKVFFPPQTKSHAANASGESSGKNNNNHSKETSNTKSEAPTSDDAAVITKS